MSLLSEFSHYNRFHKTVVLVVSAIVIAMIVRAMMVINGGVLTIEQKMVLPYEPADIWPYVSDPTLRDNWITHLTDHAHLSGDPQEKGSTRLLFWKDGFKHWSGDETTLQVVDKALYQTYITTKDYEANWDVSLTVLGDCRTEVTFKVVERQKGYTKRYFAPLSAGQKKEDLKVSLDYLKIWAGKKTTCPASSS